MKAPDHIFPCAVVTLASGVFVARLLPSWSTTADDVGPWGAWLAVLFLQLFVVGSAAFGQLLSRLVPRAANPRLSASFTAAFVVGLAVNLASYYVITAPLGIPRFCVVVILFAFLVYAVASIVGRRPNNSFKPNPLRGSA